MARRILPTVGDPNSLQRKIKRRFLVNIIGDICGGSMITPKELDLGLTGNIHPGILRRTRRYLVFVDITQRKEDFKRTLSPAI